MPARSLGSAFGVSKIAQKIPKIAGERRMVRGCAGPRKGSKAWDSDFCILTSVFQSLRAHRASLFSRQDSPNKAVLGGVIRATPEIRKKNHRTEATVVTVDVLLAVWGSAFQVRSSKGESEDR
jgi:hypothetical protein